MREFRLLTCTLKVMFRGINNICLNFRGITNLGLEESTTYQRLLGESTTWC